MKCMRNGGTLFFLDSAMDVHYKQMSSSAESLGNMSQIYGPRIEEFHTLSLDSVRTFFDLYKRYFGRFLCLTNCFVSSSAWHKTEMVSLECQCKSFTATMDMEFLECTGECDGIKSPTLQPDKPAALSMRNLQLDKPDTLMKNLQLDKETGNLKLHKLETLSLNNMQNKSSTMDKVISSLPDKMLLDTTKTDNSELVGKLLMDRCSIFIQKEDLMWRKSERQAVSRLTARMVQFRAQIGKLLANEFEQVDLENKVLFDDVDPPPDDAFDSLLTEYFDSVPEYFFQTKSKKKRIFTGLPVSI